jgi:hypothetical protein
MPEGYFFLCLHLSPRAQVSSPTASANFSTMREPLLGVGRHSFDFPSTDDAEVSLSLGV